MPQTFEDVACTVCGCVCDDLRLTFEGERLVDAERACSLAKPYGGTLPWPENNGRPARAAGALVVLSSGRPLVWFDQRSHHVVVFPAAVTEVRRPSAS